MQDFEAIRSHVGALYTLNQNAPYLVSFDLALGAGRQQGIYLAEMEDEQQRLYLRISTPIGPLAGTDAIRCLRFNWAQRMGFLAVSDLDGVPYLQLCANRPYELLNPRELQRLINELGELGDHLEQILAGDTDAS
ncbi:MAG TPA: hypothetical protein VF269_02210 [Rhodanobacteraceae bacterium]